jgi:hypothetical protein
MLLNLIMASIQRLIPVGNVPLQSKNPVSDSRVTTSPIDAGISNVWDVIYVDEPCSPIKQGGVIRNKKLSVIHALETGIYRKNFLTYKLDLKRLHF